MTQNLFPDKLKPMGEDYLRAIGYLAIGAWAVVFAIFPPTAFTSALDATTRYGWLSVTFIGAVIAIIGSMTRRDLKVELPGIFVLAVGPLFYWISQLYYATGLSGQASITDPTQRYALAVYAFIPVILLAPRVFSLLKEIRRQKKINRRASKGAK